jgi:hypothetical protein
MTACEGTLNALRGGRGFDEARNTGVRRGFVRIRELVEANSVFIDLQVLKPVMESTCSLQGFAPPLVALFCHNGQLYTFHQRH